MQINSKKTYSLKHLNYFCLVISYIFEKVRLDFVLF